VTFRPLEFLGDTAKRPLRLVTEHAILDGAHYIKLKQPSQHSVMTYWVDPSRDYVVVRWELNVQGLGKTYAWVAIDYQFDKQHGWLPSGWQTDGDYQRSGWEYSATRPSRSTVFESTINPALSRATFASNFPPGLTVVDHAQKEIYTVASDGSKTNILKIDSPNAAGH
jgi:hypothetical protein